MVLLGIWNFILATLHTDPWYPWNPWQHLTVSILDAWESSRGTHYIALHCIQINHIRSLRIFQLASKANPKSMSSGIATVIKDQTSHSFSLLSQAAIALLGFEKNKNNGYHSGAFCHKMQSNAYTLHITALCSALQQGSRRWWWPKTCCGRSWVKLFNILGWVHLAYCQMQVECSLLHGAAPGASLSWPVSMSSSFAWRYRM